MKKLLVRVLMLISILIIGYQQFAYADMYIPDSVEMYFPFAVIVGFIATIGIVLTALSFFYMKWSLKRDVKLNNGNKDTNLKHEKALKKEKIIKIIMCICITVVAYLALRYSAYFHERKLDKLRYVSYNWLTKTKDTIPEYVFLIPAILYAIALLFRVFKNKKVSKIIWLITTSVICIITMWNLLSTKIVNHNLAKYIRYEIDYEGSNIPVDFNTDIRNPYYVMDVRGIVNEVINNNKKSLNKVTLIYEHEEYKSVEELQQLLNKIDLSKRYFVINEYNYNLTGLRSITFVPSWDKAYTRAKMWSKNERNASSIVSFLEMLDQEANIISIVDLIYVSENGKEIYTNFKSYTRDGYDAIMEIVKANIDTEKTYTIEILTGADRPCDFKVKPNN